MIDYVIDNCMIPGKIENFIAIIDARDVWATQIPATKIKPFIDVLKSAYRGRLYRFFSVNVGMMLRAVWKVLKAFLDESTQRLMVIHGGSYKKDLLELIDEDKLEKKFGGKYPDMEDGFYPPKLD